MVAKPNNRLARELANSAAIETNYLDDQTVVLGGQDGLSLSTDGGETFTIVRDADIKRDPPFGDCHLYRSRDGGSSWELVELP